MYQIYNIHNVSVMELIKYNGMVGKKVYVFDIFRTEMEQKQSLFFENIDTFHFNAGASASAALWAGLPIVCKTGKGFTTRVTASMLSAIGMHELITETVQDYETLVLNLATNPKRLASIQRNLKHNRSSTPLFDTELFTKHLEDGYQKAYQRYFDGKQPRNIIVEE